MDVSLHTLRTLARSLSGGLALLFLWSSLVAVAAPPARATPPADLPMTHHAMAEHHHAGHPAAQATQQTPPPQHHTTHHHGDGACCLAGQSCSSVCNLTLLASPLYADLRLGQRLPFSPLATQAVTRSPQPPRRPPKA
ncbi:MAG TPA: hypothetical protein VGE00_04510 [Gammaproteobacteria bacterium]